MQINSIITLSTENLDDLLNAALFSFLITWNNIGALNEN